MLCATVPDRGQPVARARRSTGKEMCESTDSGAQSIESDTRLSEGASITGCAAVRTDDTRKGKLSVPPAVDRGNTQTGSSGQGEGEGS